METITNAAFENAMKKQPPADTSTLKDLFTGAGNTYKIPKEMHTAYTSALKKKTYSEDMVWKSMRKISTTQYKLSFR